MIDVWGKNKNHKCKNPRCGRMIGVAEYCCSLCSESDGYKHAPYHTKRCNERHIEYLRERGYFRESRKR